ncbi:hypothetical protein SSX86_008700 [Deinandra increscens subsp. villosa]|uniref:Uncharacterized protein n=1 Tax=Deinandra increscens subsp. villosa TaxID=3103831 RepID=A0AAP0H5A3_9ASTR
MATSINRPPTISITSLLLSILLLAARGSCESVPGFYIFGDSLVDVGNNNHLIVTLARANMRHNGVDFPTGKATGRFSNGKNAADFLAEKVGLPSPPPYMSLVPKSKQSRDLNAPVTGVNFASGGAGILNGTDELFRESYPLTRQVGYFSLVHDQLVQQLGSDKAQAHLSKSLFLVVIGSNDLFDYFNKMSKVSKQYTPEQYVDLMLSTLKGLSKRLYELGARKFTVNGVGLIGCCPIFRKKSTSSDCDAEANLLAMKYNDGLKTLLEELKNESSDIRYSYFDTYNAVDNIIQHPETYGITEIREACCGRGTLKAEALCTPLSTYCSNRKNYLFWDLFHPTEYTSSIIADLIYNGSQQVTTPMNLEQLINL